MTVRALRGFVCSLPGVLWLMCVLGSAAPAHLEPGLDPDASWRLTLQLARLDGARFGPDVAFTYGPWGFLDDPNAVSRTGVVLGTAFALACVSGTWWALWRLLRDPLGRCPAAVVATGSITVVAMPIGVSALAFAGLVAVLVAYVTEESWARFPWLPAAAAAAGAFLSQVKLSVGASVLAAVFVACAFGPAPRVRRTVESVVAAVVTFATAWVTAGQDLADLPTWLSRSRDVVGGYSEAMGLDPASPWTAYGLALVTVTLTAVALWRGSAQLPGRARRGLLALAVLSAYVGYRQGFGRFDPLHQAIFYVALLPFAVRAVAMRPRAVVRWAVLVLVVIIGRNGTQSLHPGRTMERWQTAAHLVVDEDYRQQVIEQARERGRAEAAVHPALVARAQGSSLSVDGYSTGLAWMEGFPLVAPPAFQSYVAYTAGLDRINASWLRDRPVGHLVLRPSATAIDGRYSLWDPPRYVLEEMCRTRVVDSARRWLLLSTASDRCADPVDLGTARVPAAATVPIPASPGAIVVMSFTPDGPGPLGRIARLLAANSPPLHVTVDGLRIRVPAALADGPLIVAVPPVVGWPASHGGGVAYRTVSFDRGGTVSFRSIRVGAS